MTPTDDVTFVCCTCSRPSLFLASAHSFMNNCADSDCIERFLVIAEHCPQAERAALLESFPQWRFIFKSQGELGQARSLNRALEEVTTPCMVYWEDDTFLAKRGRWLEQALDVMSHDRTIKSVSFDHSVARGRRLVTAAGTNYREMTTPDKARLVAADDFIYRLDPWPPFSLRSQLLAVAEVGNSVGFFDERDASHFEYRFARRFQDAGFRSAVLCDVALEDLSGGVSSYRTTGQVRSWERFHGLGAWSPLPRRLARSPLATTTAVASAAIDCARRRTPRGDAGVP